MEMSHCNELALTLEKTLSPALEERRRAENLLASTERHPGYSVCLLAILQDTNRAKNIRLSAATILKNYIKRYWKTEAESDNLIPDADREQLKAQLINAMLTSTGSSQHMLSEAIGLIGREDFPARWPSLLPDIIQRITQLGTELDSVQGLLYTAHSLFKRYRHEMRSDDLFTEMKLVIEQFAQPLTTLTINLMNLVVGPNRSTDGNQLVPVMRALLLVCKIFLSLNCQDLPEFFEDNMAQWMDIFRQLLHLDPQITDLINNATSADAATDLVEQVKSQVCDNIALYATKYASDFTNYLPEFVKDIWEMLISMKNTKDPKYDTLIGNALDFLSSVVSKPQHRVIFEAPDALQKLCELIILPNIQLSANDEELFEDSPEEYIRRDLEGSDAHTRRRSACNLVYALCDAFEGPVIDNFAGYINHLLTAYAQGIAQASSNSNNSAIPPPSVNIPTSIWCNKDSALLLVTSLAAKSKTEKLGVTSSSKLVNIPTFFETHVLPELQSPNIDQMPVIKADCLRYAIAFRGLLSPATILNLVNVAPNFLTASSVVVHSYAAVLLEKILLMTIPDRPSLTPLITKTEISNPDLLIQRCLEALSRSASCENVYLMRALLRICCCLEERCLSYMNNLVTALVTRLAQIVKNPSKPQFNHFLFECLCLCVRLTCATDPAFITHFENALFMIFQEILQQDITEFFPYVFQLLAVMLEQYPLGPNTREIFLQKRKMAGLEPLPQHQQLSNQPMLNPAYAALLPRLLVPALWETQGAVMSLARLMQAYLLHNVEAIVRTNKVEAILGVYQRLLNSKTNDVYAFSIISAFLLAFPRANLQPFLKQIFICIFQRLQAAKTEKFMRCLTTFLAQFVLTFGANELIQIVDGVQNRIFSRVLEKVLIPHAELAISSPVGLINPSVIITAHSNAGDGQQGANGAGGAYASLSSTCFSRLAREDYLTVAAGLSTLVTQADAICSPMPNGMTTSYHADAFVLLVQSILAGLLAGPARCGAIAADAAVLSATAENANSANPPPIFTDERFTDVTGESASFVLIFGRFKLPNLSPGVFDPRIHFAKSLENLSRRFPGKISQELQTRLSDEAKATLEAYCAQAMVRLE
ncbi:unnamed protein product [Hymenolepis diminuta]|uniref:Exportin-2 n=1 Tax=Hymenolepis diminuta TaxID=6216 RepID=A0A158QFU8_HYMDI|nr:unnamed protein product [Hymenolepis diminuta]VUZ52306.1 unnamed protein product [Hymenolepis diminuta]